MTGKNIVISKARIAEFCKRNHIRKLSLFGSVLREDFRPDSDVDVLVEFVQGRGPGFFGLARMEREFSVILGVRKVDLRTPQELSRYFRDEVLLSAEVQYADWNTVTKDLPLLISNLEKIVPFEEHP